MKSKLFITAAALLFTAGLANAQSTTIEQKIIIEKDTEAPRVTIVTVENGERSTKVLEGDEACKYIRDHERRSSGTIAGAEITNLDIEKIGRGFDRVGDDMFRVISVVNEGDINAAMSIVNEEVKASTNAMRNAIECAF